MAFSSLAGHAGFAGGPSFPELGCGFQMLRGVVEDAVSARTARGLVGGRVNDLFEGFALPLRCRRSRLVAVVDIGLRSVVQVVVVFQSLAAQCRNASSAVMGIGKIGNAESQWVECPPRWWLVGWDERWGRATGQGQPRPPPSVPVSRVKYRVRLRVGRARAHPLFQRSPASVVVHRRRRVWPTSRAGIRTVEIDHCSLTS